LGRRRTGRDTNSRSGDCCACDCRPRISICRGTVAIYRRTIRSAAVWSACSGTAIRPAHGNATRRPTVRRAAIGPMHCAPAECFLRGQQCDQGGRQSNQCFHCAIPFGSILVAPFGGVKAKSESGGFKPTFQSDISAMKRGSPGSDR